MKADSTSLVSLFLKDVQYRVPLYQRPYVWTKEKQWEPLIEEVLDVANAELTRESVAGSRPSPPHFMGAIVFNNIDFASTTFEARAVIDGQQRLTTLQLLLGASAQAFSERSQHAPARVLRDLIHNKEDLVTQSDESFKVWPTNANRDAFTAVMGPSGPHPGAEDDPDNLIQEAYWFFHARISEWLDEDGPNPEDLAGKAIALRDVLRQKIKLVVIDLEEEDDPQVIFETLNDRGTPLLKIDLVKNLVFQQAEAIKADTKRLYEDDWTKFDQPVWRAAATVGREKVVRAETFLMHWLTMQLATEVKIPHLFVRFRELLEAPDSPDVVSRVREFARDAEVFAAFDEQPAGSVEAAFFGRMRILDTTTPFPLVLFLFRQPANVLSGGRRRRALRLLESWFVRRMVCRWTAKNYNRFLIDVLQAVRNDPANADDVIFAMLASAEASTNEWPNDDVVAQVLTTLPIYKRQVTVARTKMLLSAAEQQLRSAFTESIALPDDLTVEHIMPRAWSPHWPLRNEDPDLRQDRENHIDRLGNLTLVTGGLNSSASNGPWESKRTALNAHSALFLNRPVVEHSIAWDEAAIDARSQVLSQLILAAWPGPSEENWPSVAT